jgi:2',3'-cyclic-nucleotide 2'-phosphodiesterase (5'-nucleotidase family)
LHGQINRFTAHGSQPIFSRLVWRLQELRDQQRHDPDCGLLFLSAGDDQTGSLFDGLIEGGINSHPKHVAYHIYSAAGLDAGVVGNHDLDIGPERLANAIKHNARFPLLSANLTASPALRGLVHPAALIVLDGVRVAVIGLTTPAQIHQYPHEPLKMVNPIDVMRNLLPAVRQVSDIIIVLSHLGYSLLSQTAAVAQAGDVELAQQMPLGSVHLIIGGHTHETLNENGLSCQNIINGIPIVQAGSLGRYLGEVTLTKNHSVTVTDAFLMPTFDLPVDKKFESEVIQPILSQVQPKLKQKLGALTLHPDLSRDTVRNDFASGESALANFISDAIVARCRLQLLPVDFAIIDASVVHDGFPMSPHLIRKDFYRLMPFPDTIRLSRITGRMLHDLLVDNAQRYNFPGEPHTERGFLHFSREVRYQIHLGLNRHESFIDQVFVNDQPLEAQLDRKFLVAFPSFLRQMAAPWEKQLSEHADFLRMNIRSWVYQDTGLFLRWEMLAYIHEQGGIIERAGARRDGRLQVAQHVFSQVAV